MALLMWAIGIVGLYILVKAVLTSRIGRCHSRADLSGKTVIITGGNRGIGYHVALDLATRNAHVILANRGGPLSDAATTQIQNETGNKNIRHKHLDLSSLESVRKFCAEIIKEEPRLDILINNAAISSHPKTITKDGLEINMATNHFGPFLLTNLLLDLLKKSSPSRIIVTSSIIYPWGKINFDNFRGEKPLDMGNIYMETKLAGVLFAQEMARRLQDTGVTVNSLHPGTVHTTLLEHLPRGIRQLMFIISWLFFRPVEEGRHTTVYLAVSPEVEGVTGKHFSECHEETLSEIALDEGLAKKLWDASEQLTGLNNN